MEIQWPLILFTFFNCLASGIFLVQGILTLAGNGKAMQLASCVSAIVALAVGGLAALVTYHGMPVYEQLEKPVFTPPSFLFPIVWNLLYVLMGIGAARVWLSQDPMRGQRLRPFVLQLILNFFWTVWFFGAGQYLLAFFWLLILLCVIGWMIAAFSKADPLAGRLQIPYLLWTGFAAVLNFSIFLLNL